jgi:hypothetical protein
VEFEDGRIDDEVTNEAIAYGVASRAWGVGKRWMPLGAVGTILDPKGKATV